MPDPSAASRCAVEGCDRPAQCKGWCKTHYTRWKRTGDPGAARIHPRRNGDPVARFWTHVDKTNGCWLWTGALLKRDGYGVVTIDNRMLKVHRVAYEWLVGPIPAGLVLDHTCHNEAVPPCLLGADCPHRRCVNPAHLEPVTLRVNTMRGNTVVAANAAQTHCKRGHPLSGPNLHIVNGHRHCVECRRLHARSRGTSR